MTPFEIVYFVGVLTGLAATVAYAIWNLYEELTNAHHRTSALFAPSAYWFQ